MKRVFRLSFFAMAFGVGLGLAGAQTPPDQAASTPAKLSAAVIAEPTLSPVAPATSVIQSTPAKTGESDAKLDDEQGSGRDSVGIFGDSVARTKVEGSVVAIFGDSKALDDVSNAVVAIFGDARAEKQVGDAVVAVFGDVYVNGHVHNAVVAVFGDVELGPQAVVDGDVSSIGGSLHRDPHAVISGHIAALSLTGRNGAFWYWVRHAVFKGRLLAMGYHSAWASCVALVFLGGYVLIGLIFSGAVNRCVENFEQRPGWTIVATLLTALIAPVLLVLLIVTVFGAAFLVLALLLIALFGKAAFLAWIGRRFYRAPGPAGTALAVLVGGLVMLLLLALPIVGVIAWFVGSSLGLGMTMYTLIAPMRRPRPPIGRVQTQSLETENRPLIPPTSATPLVNQTVAAPIPLIPTPLPPPATLPDTPTVPPLRPEPSVSISTTPRSPIAVSASTLPRAGFMLRLAASILDLILIGMFAKLIHLVDWFFLLYTVYCVVMWTKKATTVGGIICNLKLVRLDDRPIDWSIASIRSLGAFLSAVVCGLGFIWVAFDDEAQSWHDRIAGTTIVRVPKGTSLI